jgi:glycosyltransferase involved in cell wall biosynthesis
MSLDFLRVYNINKSKIRIGSEGDGGYVFVDGLEYDCFISCGISNDINFEKQFCVKYPNIPCYAYDGTIDKLPEDIPQINFIKKNITYYNSDTTTNLIDLLDKYDNIFIKMDIETYEYRWIQSLSEKHLNKIKQLVIEFHYPFTYVVFKDLDLPLDVKDKLGVIEKITKTHTLIHFHPNNAGPTDYYNNIYVPFLFECTYIRNDVYPVKILNTENIPTSVDKQNVPGNDIYLTDYPFVAKKKKLVFYMTSGIPHPKNWDAIQRMCRSYNIDFEYTNDLERLKRNDYDILYTIMYYVDPDIIPNNIKIVYGPQFWVIPEPPIVGKYRPELEGRCVFNSLSKWVANYYLELGKELIMPLGQFPFSVDTDKFKPLEPSCPKEYDCIVYIKRRSNKLVNNVLNLLSNKDLRYKIFKYGSYNEEDYKWSLHRSKFMISLDAHESQGFGLEEAMSCNVPLLVIDAQSMYDEMDDGNNATYKYLEPAKLEATSVPYWSSECGIKLKGDIGLNEAIDYMTSYYKDFNPRDYIIKTLSNEVCMKRILDYFKL